jgi:hypothetical protein
MSEPAQAPPAPAPAPPAAPAGPQHEGFFGRFAHHAEAEAAPLVADEVRFLIHGHAAGLYGAAAEVFSRPEFQALRPEMLSLVASVTELVGKAL